MGNVTQVGRLARILGCGDKADGGRKYWLASWKMMYLSMGGKVTLIKSTFANMPMYYMSLFPLPTSVTNHIEKIQRDFLWSGLGEEFKYHLVWFFFF
jgi:hypothetical protein